MADDIDIGVNVHSDGADLLDSIRNKYLALKRDLGGGKSTSADINIAIGQFQQLGRVIDTTSQQAVEGFRRMGEELQRELAVLGATESEINKVAGAVNRAEQQFGSFQASLALGSTEIERLPQGARRGANALTTLAFGMSTGAGSARSMAIAMGTTIGSLSQFASSARVAAAATGIGALVTVLVTVIDLLNRTGEEGKKAAGNLGELSHLRSNQLSILQAQHQRLVESVTQEIVSYNNLAKAAASTYTAVGTLAAASAIYSAGKASERLKVLTEEKNKLDKAFVEASSQEQRELVEKTLKDQSSANQAIIANERGHYAERRQQAHDDYQAELRELDRRFGSLNKKTADEIQLRRKLEANLASIARDEQENFRAITEKAQIARIDAEAKLDSDEYQKKRNVADREFELEKERIKHDDALRNNKVLQNRLIVLNEQTHTANLTAIERDRTEEVDKIKSEAADKISGLSDLGVDETKIRQGYKKQIDILNAAIASSATDPAVKAAAQEGIDLINALIPEEIAKKRMDQLNKSLQAEIQAGDTNLKRIDLLVASHQETNAQAQEQRLTTLRKQRDEIEQTLPALEAQAKLLPGNSEELEKIEALRTKLLELNITIMQTADDFYQLKETGIQATQAALEKLITSAPAKLFGQDQALASVKVTQQHLKDAQADLQRLLNLPKEQQTADTTNRIIAIRNEIAQTTIELNNQKKAITTWRTLFVEAAHSIVSALFEVATHMLAVYTIQNLLLAFRGGGGSAAGSILQLSGDVLSGVSAASGGYIRGPGTGTSDSIPAWLSNGEYVIKADAVRKLGTEFLDSINAAGTIRRPSNGKYASGGLVQHSGGTRSALDATLGLEDGLVIRHIKTDEGTKAILTVIGKNRKAVNALLGNG